MDEDTMLPIPKGSLLTISTGEHSDYCVQGVFQALGDIDANALRQEWLEAHPGQEEDYSSDKFLGWVARKGLIESLDSYEWHLADYSIASYMSVEKNDKDETI